MQRNLPADLEADVSSATKRPLEFVLELSEMPFQCNLGTTFAAVPGRIGASHGKKLVCTKHLPRTHPGDRAEPALDTRYEDWCS